MEWREREGVRWLDAELPGARAAFSTRAGGISEGPFESLNLGVLTGDEPAQVAENRRRLAAVLSLRPERIVIGRQVHGAEVLRHDGPQSPSPFVGPGHDPLRGEAVPSAPARGGIPPPADGHALEAGDLAALVFVADCLPVAVAGEAGVAILHCGWRGLAGGIVERGVAAIGATAAAIGPGIGPCCYEVGEEVLASFLPLGVGGGAAEGGGKGGVAPHVAEGRMLDLPGVARLLLERAGVERVESAGHCTSCEPELFFSHRRDGPRTGRQGGLVWREAAG